MPKKYKELRLNKISCLKSDVPSPKGWHKVSPMDKESMGMGGL